MRHDDVRLSFPGAFFALVDGTSKCGLVKIGRYKLFANRLNNFVKAALIERHIHRHSPPTLDNVSAGKPDGGGDVSGDGLQTRPRA